MKETIGFIGCGNMGTGLLEGILGEKLARPKDITIYDVSTDRRNTLKKKYKVKTVSSLKGLMHSSKILILAVKPQQLSKLSRELSENITASHTVASILAGTTLSSLKKVMGSKAGVVRVMPNLGAIVGESLSALSSKSPKSLKKVRPIFESCGEVIEIKESFMNLVTAISGSGPAYFFHLMELLEIEGRRAGLSGKVAHNLSVQTALGAALLAKGSNQSPGELRKMVTSKKGTTEAALQVFKKNKFAKTVKNAVKAATKRAKELSG
jgi:pyrroline-5-carboxylate reductase